MKTIILVPGGMSTDARPPPPTNPQQTGIPPGDGRNGHKTGPRQGWQGGVGCLLCWLVITSVTAQEAKPVPVVTSLSLATVPWANRSRNLREPSPARSVRLPENANCALVEPPHRSTEAEAWERFEAEYGPPQRSASPIKGQLESAKYGLDVAIFSCDRLIRNINDRSHFTLEHGHLHYASPGDRSRSGPTANGWMDGQRKVRVKLDLQPRIGQPYVGGRVIIPLGN